MRDCKERGRLGDCRNFGEDNGRTVVPDDVVQHIRERYVKGSRTDGLPALAKCYGISISQVYRIANGHQRTQVNP